LITSINRLLAFLVGVGYLLVGVGGFFATADGLLLQVFEVNLLLNLTHIAIGAALVIAWLAGVRASKAVNTIAGTVCLVLGFVGLFVVGTAVNFLALNGADNVLHFASAMLLLAAGVGAERTPRT
jgi:hypothetical protein